FGIFTAAAQDVSFSTAAPRVVGVGENFRITINLSAEPEHFTPPEFSGLSILAGPSKSTMTNIQMVNGRTTQSFTVTYTYIVQATAEGKAQIGAAKATVDGKSYQTQPVSIDVVKDAPAQQGAQQSGQQGGQPQNRGNTNQPSADETDVFVRIQFNKSQVVRGEYLTATIKLYTRQMNILGFENYKFPTFNGFWSQEIESPQRLNFQRETFDGKIYNVAVVRRYALFPQQTGTLKIDPVEITCVLQVKGNSQPRSFFDSFFDTPQSIRKNIASPIVAIEVHKLPDGAPASFKGTVGSNFQMEARFNRDSIQANDAVNLVVRISGEGNLKLLESPQVNFPPHFETYDTKITDNTKASDFGISGSKSFEYPVIPRSEGSFDIPGPEFSYYDINKKQYVTLRSNDLHIGVSKDPNAGTAVTTQGINQQSVKSLNSDIQYIKRAPLALGSTVLFFGSMPYYAVFIALLLLFFIIYFQLKRHIKRTQDIRRTRHRKATKIAKKRLKAAGEFLRQHNMNSFYDELSRAMWGFLTDKAGLSVADLSREKAREVMQAKNAKEEDITAYLQVLDECEFARYAPGAGQSAMQKVYEVAIQIISKFEQTF
ncbi:MAG: BatD family protein, partial [Bacteroidales bacterium]|nr:BatD family protein [Bacteroidales bacterium]